jgi:hypothetical protein
MDIFLPIQWIADYFSYNLLKLTETDHFAKSVNFFIYDTLKIFILLLFINFAMAVVRYYLPTNRIKKILTSRKWYGMDYLLAAIFGVITPFCSCSSIPLFIGFLSSGIPLGVTFTFLITSPLVNEASLALFPALFGWKITLIYNIVGIFIGILGGVIIQKLKMDKYVESSFLKIKSTSNLDIRNTKQTLTKLFKFWWNEGWQITKSLIPYILVGIGIGAVIHGFIPANFFEKYLSGSNLWSVPVATIIGVPFYANSVSVIPIIKALIDKGIPFGTAIAFMTATVTLSIPEALILKKVMKIPLLLSFFTITTVGIMLIGYLFNFLF